MALDHDISVLNSLITATIDSANGFEKSAEEADAARFEELFSQYATERRQVVARLQDEVRRLGGTANDDGSLQADLHRRWIELRTAVVNDGSDQAVIAEVERGEDHLKGKYDAVLDDEGLLPGTMEAIHEAYRSVRAGHDRASQLKHGMAGVEG